MTSTPQYKKLSLDYIVKNKKQDFTQRTQGKKVSKEPMQSGLYGFTYLTSHLMAVNDKIDYQKNIETQLHEDIHTPDEYETRVITNWMLDQNLY